MLLKVQQLLAAATVYMTFRPHVSLPPQLSKTKCKAALELLAMYFTVQHLITESAVALVACVR